MNQSGYSSSPSGIMRRREARRIAMTLLYAQTCTGYPLDEVVVLLRGVRADWSELPSFSEKLSFAVQRNELEIERHVAGALENWRITRLSPVEKTLLMLGCAEILYFPDIPPRVTINEYIELAKIFCNENAPAFINGILDKLVHQTGKPDALKK